MFTGRFSIGEVVLATISGERGGQAWDEGLLAPSETEQV